MIGIGSASVSGEVSQPSAKGNFSAVTHEMSEMLMRLDLTSREHRIVWFLIREIIGYQLKQKVIKNKQFVQSTGMARQHVHSTILSLIEKGVIWREEVRGEPGEYLYGFNERSFGRVHATEQVREDRNTVTKMMTPPSSKRLHLCTQDSDIDVTKVVTQNTLEAATGAETQAPKYTLKDIKNIIKEAKPEELNAQVPKEREPENSSQPDWIHADQIDIEARKEFLRQQARMNS